MSVFSFLSTLKYEINAIFKPVLHSKAFSPLRNAFVLNTPVNSDHIPSSGRSIPRYLNRLPSSAWNPIISVLWMPFLLTAGIKCSEAFGLHLNCTVES